MSVDTKAAEGRRTIKFNCINCLKGDLNRVQAAHDAGTLHTVGNWSAGQILQHCAMLAGFALDGFPAKAPFVVKLFFMLFAKRRALQDRPMNSGYTLPKQAAFMLPQDDVTFEQGMGAMRAVVARLDAGERMDKPSPIFGTLAHEQTMDGHDAATQRHASLIHHVGLSFKNLGRR